MIDTTRPEIDFALNAVRQACLLVRQIQRDLVLPTLTKSDRSPVTIADFAGQALIAFQLGRDFPGAALIAEEDARELRDAQSGFLLERISTYIREYVPQASAADICDWINRGRTPEANRYWTLDPIDGTKGFLRRDQYAVALALVEDGEVKVGVLGCPNLVNGRIPDQEGAGSLVIAVRGEGTWTCAITKPTELTRMQVSNRNDPSQARLLRSFESGHTNTDQTAQFLKIIGSQADPLLMDSQAKYSLLASGEGELLLRLLSKAQPDYREKVWDQAAGSIILEEAGGKITDLDGRELDFSLGRTLRNNRGILASNQVLHSFALDALRSLGV